MTRNKNDWGEINETETKAKYTESIKKKNGFFKTGDKVGEPLPK